MSRTVSRLHTRATHVMAQLPRGVQRELRDLPPDDAVYWLNEFHRLAVAQRRTNRFITFVMYVCGAAIVVGILHSLLR